MKKSLYFIFLILISVFGCQQSPENFNRIISQFEKVSIDATNTVTIPGMSPKLTGTPGGTQWAGPKLGQHTDEILKGILGISDEKLRILKDEAVI